LKGETPLVVATCPAITVPGGPACGGPVHSLTDLIECATCVANYKVECLTALAVPWGIQYPAECNASCGNGVREASEICDGNDAVACPGACQADCTCASVATPTPHASASPTPAATPGPPVACGAAPRTDCRAPVESGGSVLLLEHATNDRKDHLVWKWTHGALTTRAEFGEPFAAGGTSYALCLYDHAGGAAHLQLAAKAPAGESCDLDHPHPCWRATHDGARYLDKDLTPDGIRRIRLKEGLPGKARISVTGRGPNLALPDPGSLAEPVTVQLVNSLGTCWEGTFIAPALRQDARAFRDTSE